MKVRINNVKSIQDEYAEIHVVKVTNDIQYAINILEQNCIRIPVVENKETIICDIKTIYYIESVDKRTFVYTKDKCFETKYRLYELENMLDNNFIRCSKSIIFNVRKLHSVKADINARMVAKLLNGDQIVIARSYVKKLKERLGI